MGLYISTKLIGIIAFIMIFTYTAEGIILLDNSALEKAQTGSFKQAYLSFNDWIDTSFTYERDVILNHTYLQDWTTTSRFHFIILSCATKFSGTDFDYQDRYLAFFDFYKTGVSFWERGGLTSQAKKEIKEDYRRYLKDFGWDFDEYGVLKTYQKNFVENAIDFLAKVPEAFGKIVDLLTFNIKDSYGATVIPAEAMFFLNIFFMPMWILLTIEALPLIAKIIEAIGSLIPF